MTLALTGVRRWIASHRRLRLARRIAGVCSAYLDAYHNVSYDPCSNGEASVLKAFGDPEVHCVMDVGANLGQWTVLARQAFPNALIHCFEIERETCARLRQAVGSLPRVIINDAGLADQPGEVEIKAYPTAPTLNSLLDYPHPIPSTSRRAVVTTGDEYARSHALGSVDFLKIDVEGSEGHVLRGCHDLLTQGRVQVVQFEYGRANILANFLLRDLYALLTGCGYTVGKIFPDHVDFREYRLSDEDFRGVNYLAVRRERADLLERVAG